jgi:hypothetical protein
MYVYERAIQRTKPNLNPTKNSTTFHRCSYNDPLRPQHHAPQPSNSIK